MENLTVTMPMSKYEKMKRAEGRLKTLTDSIKGCVEHENVAAYIKNIVKETIERENRVYDVKSSEPTIIPRVYADRQYTLFIENIKDSFALFPLAVNIEKVYSLIRSVCEEQCKEEVYKEMTQYMQFKVEEKHEETE